MWLDVNGQRMQTGNTKTMIFNVKQIVSHLSQLFTYTQVILSQLEHRPVLVWE